MLDVNLKLYRLCERRISFLPACAWSGLITCAALYNINVVSLVTNWFLMLGKVSVQ